jgi:hypothetical protein
VDEREMTHALWTTPQAALRAREAGSLKLILPTVETLEKLSTFPDSRAALSALGKSVVATNLPGAGPSRAETKSFAPQSARNRFFEP